MNTIICAVFATLCIHSVYCQQPTNISDKKSVRVIDSSEQLECLIPSPMDLNMSWVKVDKENTNKTIVLTYGNEVVIDDLRFSLQKDVVTKPFKGSRLTLTISDLIISDTGLYRCQAMHQSNNIIFTKIELEVRKQTPVTIFNNITSMLVVMEGKSLTLECHASGFPEPTIYWRRENDKVLFTGRLAHRGNILEIPFTKKEDRGNYYCFAENGIRPSPRRTISVVVEFPPVVTTSQRFHEQVLNYYANLDCRIEACPASTVIWEYKGIQLSNNQYYKISNMATSSNEIVDSNLRFNITQKHLYGDYVCKTFNMFGAAEVTIKLYETTIKNCPPTCDYI